MGVDPFGRMRTLLDRHGPFWRRVDPFRGVWTLLVGVDHTTFQEVFVIGDDPP